MVLEAVIVTANTDDGGVYGATFQNDWGENYIGDTGGDYLAAYARFLSVTVPQGATIDDATLTIELMANWLTGSMTIRATAEDVDSATIPTSVANFLAKARTTANDDSVVTDAASVDDEITFDVQAVVQEIVDRGGWSSDNALMMFLDPQGSPNGNVGIKDYGATTTLCARLDINYTEASDSPPHGNLLHVGI